MKRCSEACAPLSQLPTSQHRHERPHCGTGVLHGACFSNLEVANTAQLSLCSFRATVAFSLSSHRLCCCYIATSSQSKLSWQGLRIELRLGGSWGWGSVTLHAAVSDALLCLCSVWRCSHSLWNAVLGVLEEGPPKRERRKGGGQYRRGVDLWTVHWGQ